MGVEEGVEWQPDNQMKMAGAVHMGIKRDSEDTDDELVPDQQRVCEGDWVGISDLYNEWNNIKKYGQQ